MFCLFWQFQAVKDKQLDSTLKELGIQRLATRFEIPSNTSFDKVLEERNSCNLEEQSGQDFFCDCFEGICGRLCKQSVGLLYKTGTIEVDHYVCSKPLGAKRKRGRPKKLLSCLTSSPKPLSLLNLETLLWLIPNTIREPSPAPEPWAESLTIPTALLPPRHLQRRLRD